MIMHNLTDVSATDNPHVWYHFSNMEESLKATTKNIYNWEKRHNITHMGGGGLIAKALGC